MRSDFSLNNVVQQDFSLKSNMYDDVTPVSRLTYRPACEEERILLILYHWILDISLLCENSINQPIIRLHVFITHGNNNNAEEGNRRTTCCPVAELGRLYENVLLFIIITQKPWTRDILGYILFFPAQHHDFSTRRTQLLQHAVLAVLAAAAAVTRKKER